MLRISIITALAALATSAVAQDAVQTDGDKYKVILENACVRVLDYQDAAGEKTHQHTHPAFILYALGPFKRTLTLPEGTVLRREFKAGDVMYSDAQTHIGENIGETPTHVVIVELKQAGGACSTKQ